MRDEVLRIIDRLNRDQEGEPSKVARVRMVRRLERVLDQLAATNRAGVEASLKECARVVSDSWPYSYAPGLEILALSQEGGRVGGDG